MSELPDQPPTDKIFDALSDVHRRRILIRLLDHNPQTIDQLSSAPDSAFEMNTGIVDEYLARSLEIDGIDKTAVRLYHNDLPKLEDCGFIEWDRDENEVRKGTQFDEVRPVLKLLEENREILPDDWL
ncbi:hypothetical protein [Natronococcus sp. A-GB7]|uniref:DUF7344 domain-containing protein n=1 Tax=Natronococcus sp. A-GB7 TaxID=3037649 RepID=UPI00241E8323|nr:hypothetical protein [Natronococcus sp. A-GB7]MDG5821956.1 hypothetical protein [Natronococcus sp. A-GB7]